MAGASTSTRQTPWQGLFELSYVGNRSRDQQNTQGGAGSNINLVPAGSMLSATNPATANANNYRPLQGYGDLNLATNNLYQNYNAMQVSWARHAGMYIIQTNYTFQKALGIISPTIDPFNLNANYGALASNRSHFSTPPTRLTLASGVHSNALVNGVANGWQISGVTQLESGANLTYKVGNGSVLTVSTATTTRRIPASSRLRKRLTVSRARSRLRSSRARSAPRTQRASQSTTNPSWEPVRQAVKPARHLRIRRAHAVAHQFVNGNCFAAQPCLVRMGQRCFPRPTVRRSSIRIWRVFKNFQITESMKLQLRAQAYNFLNHPLYSFPSGSNLTLQFTQDPVRQVITQANTNFGLTTQKQGSRIMEFGAKFFF